MCLLAIAERLSEVQVETDGLRSIETNSDSYYFIRCALCSGQANAQCTQALEFCEVHLNAT